MPAVTDTVISGPYLLAALLAVAAGAVSFASPCVIPLVPGYLAYLTSLVGARGRRRGAGRRAAEAGCGASRVSLAVRGQGGDRDRAVRARLHRGVPRPIGRGDRVLPGTAGQQRDPDAGRRSRHHRDGAGDARADPAAADRTPAACPADRPDPRRAAARRGLRPRLDRLPRPDAGRRAVAGQRHRLGRVGLARAVPGDLLLRRARDPVPAAGLRLQLGHRRHGLPAPEHPDHPDRRRGLPDRAGPADGDRASGATFIAWLQGRFAGIETLL